MGSSQSKMPKVKKPIQKFRPQRIRSPPKNDYFIEKRRRFRELIKICLNKSNNKEDLIKRLFYESTNQVEKEEDFVLKINPMESENIKERDDIYFYSDITPSTVDEEMPSSTSLMNSQNIILQKIDTNNSIRSKYFTSLINNQFLYKRENQTSCQNIIIFDWDDTIMCTTYLTPGGVFDETLLKSINNKREEQVFKILENQIVELLTKAKNQGHTYIVTNAASGWVEYSASLFFPKILNVLKDILIISARSWFDKEFPNNSRMWKKACFEEISHIYDSSKVTNLVTIGDSLIEMEASYEFKKNFDKCYIKTLKLKDIPSPQLLIKQLNLLNNDFLYIMKQISNITISVQKEKKIKPTANSVINARDNFKQIIDRSSNMTNFDKNALKSERILKIYNNPFDEMN
jgi:hypothetical protein